MARETSSSAVPSAARVAFSSQPRRRRLNMSLLNERRAGRLPAPHRNPPGPPLPAHLRRTRVTLKARMQRALRRTEINTTLVYYAVAFFLAKSIRCRAVCLRRT